MRPGGQPKKKTYDLNTQSDQFFSRYAGVPFPEAVEANEKELAEVSLVANLSDRRSSISYSGLKLCMFAGFAARIRNQISPWCRTLGR
jgi:hypothetical protein